MIFQRDGTGSNTCMLWQTLRLDSARPFIVLLLISVEVRTQENVDCGIFDRVQ